jgi:dipeptidyl aminopeptidase/acylaminoacyl peptidase
MLRAITGIWLGVWAGSAAAAIPVKDFARWSEVTDAKISPNGDYLAVSKWLGDGAGMIVIDLKVMKVISSFRLNRGDSIDDFIWVGPNRLVLPVAEPWGTLDQLAATGELIGINADGTDKKYLFGYRGEEVTASKVQGVKRARASAYLVHPQPEDPARAVVKVWSWDIPWDHTFPFVETLHAHSGDRHRVGQVPVYGADVIVDEQGLPRLGVGAREDGSCCKVVALPRAGGDWKTLNITPEGVTLLGVSRDGASAFFTHSEQNKPNCLQEFVFKAGTLKSLLCDPDIEFGVGLSPDQHRPVFVRREAGRPQTTVLDAADPAGRLQRSLEQSFAGYRVTVTSRTLDGTKAVVLVNGDRTPGEYFLYDSATKKVDLLLSRRKWIDPAAMQPMAPIEYPARDGLVIHGYVTAAGGLAARKLPLVVIPHGGPHEVRDFWEWDAEGQLLASRGYAVLQVNYRGSGGYGTSFGVAGYRRWGTAMLDDITDGVKWTVEKGIADPARICIYGTSYGGYAALMSAMREPDLYRCAIGHAGLYDLAAFVSDTDVAKRWQGTKYLQMALGTDTGELRAQSPLYQLARLKAPVMLVHGTGDRRAPFSQAQALHDALDKAGKRNEWLPFDGEEHGLWKEENREIFYNKMLEFLERNLGGTAPAG